MDKNNKEYIVTKIEKYEEMYDDATSGELMVKYFINIICVVIFAVLYKINLSLPEDLDIVVNQTLDSISLFGVAIPLSNLSIGVIKMSYATIMSEILKNKLQKNDIENQTELIIENKEGKTR